MINPFKRAQVVDVEDWVAKKRSILRQKMEEAKLKPQPPKEEEQYNGKKR